ncbi:MAG TPA: DUF1223 domain-containing protein [Candidatus Acidoferrum sp.]|nr:DUF1223 domain-containing protein [Candidatus Acidoferrum sp.]
MFFVGRTRGKFIRWTLILTATLACIVTGEYARSADNRDSSAAPVLLELFTSEGCSSCPPADASVQRIDTMQPFRGARVIVLSEHVDYWDQDGWKDPYSSPSFTYRQSEYVRALGLATAYTPQIIVDGTTVLRGDAAQIQETFAKAAAEPKVAVQIGSLSVDPQPGLVRAHIDVDGSAATHNADIFVAIALDHAESQVLRGENSGRDLKYVAVVEEIKKVGKLDKGKTFSRDVELKLKPGTDPKNLRIIAFVQESGPGKVLGAAMQKPGA